MTAKMTNRMFTAERLAQILLAILIVATALVVCLKRPSAKADTKESTRIVYDTIPASPNKTRYPYNAETSKHLKRSLERHYRKTNNSRTNKKEKETVKRRDHLREPMAVTGEE